MAESNPNNKTLFRNSPLALTMSPQSSSTPMETVPESIPTTQSPTTGHVARFQVDVQVETASKPVAAAEIPGKLYSLAQVHQHSTAEDFWIVVHGEVYNMTAFQNEHPGGQKVLAGLAGKDATKKFDKYHRQGILLQPKHQALRVGVVDDQVSAAGRDGKDGNGVFTGGLRVRIGKWLR